jgi:hypothetical protein
LKAEEHQEVSKKAIIQAWRVDKLFQKS